MIMNEIAERTWEFDGVDDILGDEILMEGLDDVQSAQTDDIMLVDEVSAKREDDTIPVYNSFPDDHFLLMQEPIIEDPRHEYCDLISLLEHHHHHLPGKNRVHCHIQRHFSWTAPARTHTDSGMSFRSTLASTASFKDCLDQLAKSLRQSEVTRSLIRLQMEDILDERKAGKSPNFDVVNHESRPTLATLSVDDTRRSLLSLIEMHQRSCYASSQSISRPKIRRCKSSTAT
jgi:hypothetical protein